MSDTISKPDNTTLINAGIVTQDTKNVGPATFYDGKIIIPTVQTIAPDGIATDTEDAEPAKHLESPTPTPNLETLPEEYNKHVEIVLSQMKDADKAKRLNLTDEQRKSMQDLLEKDKKPNWLQASHKFFKDLKDRKQLELVLGTLAMTQALRPSLAKVRQFTEAPEPKPAQKKQVISRQRLNAIKMGAAFVNETGEISKNLQVASGVDPDYILTMAQLELKGPLIPRGQLKIIAASAKASFAGQDTPFDVQAIPIPSHKKSPIQHGYEANLVLTPR